MPMDARGNTPARLYSVDLSTPTGPKSLRDLAISPCYEIEFLTYHA